MVTAIQLFLEVQCIDVTQPKIVSFMWGSYGLSFRLLKEMDSYSYELSTLSSRMPLKVIFVYVSRVFTAPSLWNAYFVATKPPGSFSWPPPGLDFVETSLGGRWQSVAICSVQKNRWKGLEIIGSFQLLSSLSNWYPGRISAHDGSFSLWSIFFCTKNNHEKSHLSLNSACELKCAKSIVRGDVFGVQILCLLWALIKNACYNKPWVACEHVVQN